MVRTHSCCYSKLILLPIILMARASTAVNPLRAAADIIRRQLVTHVHQIIAILLADRGYTLTKSKEQSALPYVFVVSKSCSELSYGHI